MAAPSGGGDTAALAVLAQSASGRLKKAASAYVVAVAAYKAADSLRSKIKERVSHTITLDDRDDLYPDVMAWLYESIPEEKRRSLRATSTQTDKDEPTVASGAGEPRVEAAKLRLHYDGKRTQTVNIDGHRIKIEVDTDVDPGRGTSGDYTFKVDKVTFTAGDVAGRNAVLAFLEHAAKTRIRTGPRLYLGTRWGSWHRSGGVPMRDFSTVALPDELQADLIGDLEAFLSQEDDYNRLGLPWHRGYVLHGPPGSGKTTIAKALATRFDMDMYFVPLADIEDDSSLLQMFTQLNPRSLLLLEDVDINVSMKERTDQAKGVSMSALLQALDGIVTPHGLITVMTTNVFEDLDKALIRPGRADRVFEISYLKQAQLERLVTNMTGLTREFSPIDQHMTTRTTPAEIVEVLKEHIGHPAAGVQAVEDLIGRKRRSTPATR